MSPGGGCLSTRWGSYGNVSSVNYRPLSHQNLSFAVCSGPIVSRPAKPILTSFNSIQSNPYSSFFLVIVGASLSLSSFLLTDISNGRSPVHPTSRSPAAIANFLASISPSPPTACCCCPVHLISPYIRIRGFEGGYCQRRLERGACRGIGKQQQGVRSWRGGCAIQWSVRTPPRCLFALNAGVNE